MQNKQNSVVSVRILLAVFLGAFSVLLFEMCQIRAFAFSMPPILAYSGISLAMTGFGIGAMLLSLKPHLFVSNPWERLGYLALLQAVSMLLASFIFSASSWDAVLGLKEGGFILAVIGVVIPGTLPYFFNGLFLAAIFGVLRDSIGKLYFFNLAGSALGAVGIVLLLSPVGVERLISISAALACVAAALLGLQATRRLKIASIIGLVACLSLIPLSDSLFVFEPDPTDSIGRPLSEARDGSGPAVSNEFSDWNIVARIDIWNTEGMKAHLPEEVELRVLTVDAGAVTLMMGDLGKPGWGRDLFEQTLYGMAYQVKQQPEDVLIIGAGGGTDVMTALHHGTRNITAVEVNTTTIDAVKGPFADYLGWPKRDNVELVHADGRSFVKAPGKKFDVLVMSGVDTVTVYATGAFNMVEENLYTIEAFEDYLDVIKEDGVLSVVRFGREHMRLASIAVEALIRRGIEDPRRHVVVLKQQMLGGVLVSLKPFDDEAINNIALFASRTEPTMLSIPPYEMYNLHLSQPIEPIYVPGLYTKPAFRKYFHAVERAKGDISKALTIQSIPTDDNPFYLFSGLISGGDHLLAPVKDALALLQRFWYAIVALALALIIIPVIVFGGRLSSPRSMVWVFPMFFVLGACFMMLEIGIINRFSIFVGSPGASTAVVLTAILLFSGIGAFFSDAGDRRPERTIAIATGLLVVSSVLLWLVSPPVIGACFEAEFGYFGRGLVAGLLIAPVGFSLGWFFPAGLRAINLYIKDEHLMPWAISINGFASVVGSVVALPMTIFWGFSTLFAIALAGYVVIGVLTVLFFRKAQI